jgi:MFS family permease
MSSVLRRTVERGAFAYPVLLFLSVVDSAGYGIVAPVVPEIAERTGAGPVGIAAVVGAFPVGIFLGFPLGATGVRRRGAAATLAPALGTIVVGAVGFALVDGLVAYAAMRFVAGLGSGALWIGITFGVFERWPGQEYLCLSRVFAAYSVGAVLGPVLGAVGHIRGPFLALAVVATLGALTVPLLGPGAGSAFAPDRSALRSPGFAAAAAAVLFAISMLGMLDGVMPLHLGRRLGQSQIAALYVAIALLVAVGAVLAGRIRPRAALAVAFALSIGGIAATGASDAVAVWIPALAIAGLGIGLAETGAVGVLLEAVPTSRIVTAMVVWSQVGIAGYLVGPVSGSLAAEGFGFGALGLVALVLGAGSAAVLGTSRQAQR